jgi:hypothetical protein
VVFRSPKGVWRLGGSESSTDDGNLDNTILPGGGDVQAAQVEDSNAQDAAFNFGAGNVT